MILSMKSMKRIEKILLLNPDKLVFGQGSFDQFIKDFPGTGLKKMYLITIPPMLDQLKEHLSGLKNAGISIKVDTSVQREPTLEDFEKLLVRVREFRADSVVGIGGGSVMDMAKLIAAQLKNTQETIEVMGIGNLKERSTCLVCIPTTSGTGSEVSPNAIFVNEKGEKMGVISEYLVPDQVYVDPALTVSLPPTVTAATGIDALTHCLEAYTNKFAHPVIGLIALEGVRLIGHNLYQCCKNGQDIEARTQVALGSLYGGMCLGPVNTAAVHALSYPLGAGFHIAHGLSNALLLPHVMAFNLSAAPERYANLALALGAEKGDTDLETAKAGVLIIQRLIESCGLPSSLAEVDVPDSAIGKMAVEAMQVRRLLKNNVREVTLRDAENIYKSAFNMQKV